MHIIEKRPYPFQGFHRPLLLSELLASRNRPSERGGRESGRPGEEGGGASGGLLIAGGRGVRGGPGSGGSANEEKLRHSTTYPKFPQVPRRQACWMSGTLKQMRSVRVQSDPPMRKQKSYGPLPWPDRNQDRISNSSSLGYQKYLLKIDYSLDYTFLCKHIPFLGSASACLAGSKISALGVLRGVLKESVIRF